MGRIYEKIEINGQKIKVKIDTGSDFPLSLKKEVIEKMGLKTHPTTKAKIMSEERGMVETPAYLAQVKVGDCIEFPTVVVEATGENLMGHPILQLLKAKVDEENHIIKITCPKFSFGEFRGFLEEK